MSSLIGSLYHVKEGEGGGGLRLLNIEIFYTNFFLKNSFVMTPSLITLNAENIGGSEIEFSNKCHILSTN